MMTKDEFKKALWAYGQERHCLGGEMSFEQRGIAVKSAGAIRKALLDTYDAMAARIEELERANATLQRDHDIAIVREVKARCEAEHGRPLTLVPTGTLDMLIEERCGEMAARIAELEAERDAARAEAQARLESHNAEVDELNAGFEAYRAGLSLDDQPEVVYDVWRVGYAWAAYDEMTGRIAELEAALLRVLVEAVAEDGGRCVLQKDAITEIAALLRGEG